MTFLFFCPELKQSFETDAFSITDNKGVKTTPSGQRYLDATIVLNIPCPYCGKQHTYAASELPCPF